mmetsp:Transcript_19561/g.22760  ORF Transcript_19561/g.22760 Transcript_19561/m.22760 type:complete len:93 (-) Transcript_19561:125-403(-)|eukprot:CAMPEP_0168334516 /NCGR_PEP_ID=MMETSP0213-20121227/10318_1 /TAXON_ID=151035 /ORGANISM="Euplotes harpa, Strain FSP1.4" /LENGTH=92 /DNA_ID=CAMNT_0008339183 /DNA_START=15 /DNA_END=293 /DNA_ORIENTATION=-
MTKITFQNFSLNGSPLELKHASDLQQGDGQSKCALEMSKQSFMALSKYPAESGVEANREGEKNVLFAPRLRPVEIAFDDLAPLALPMPAIKI